jgi:hypothetical protein
MVYYFWNAALCFFAIPVTETTFAPARINVLLSCAGQSESAPWFFCVEEPFLPVFEGLVWLDTYFSLTPV